MKPRVCIITALPAESRPFLDALKLRQHPARHLRLYSADNFLLLETGAGKLNAAASTGAMLQTIPHVASVVNIGIAGGAYDYADVVVAHHIKDAASGAQWFPHLPSHPELRSRVSSCVCTVDQPQTQYRDETVFDMEAAGVFTAASRYLPTSNIHSIKIISDNPDHCIERINKQQVLGLIEQSMPLTLPIVKVIFDHALSMQQPQPAPMVYFIAQILKQVHHTTNDEQQLRDLVQRLWTLSAAIPEVKTHSVSARDIRQSLQHQLSSMSLSYEEY